MAKLKESTRKCLGNAVCFVVMFVCAAVTPFIAQPIAKLFDGVTMDWSQRGQLRDLFIQLFTCIFWGLEWLGIHLAYKKYKEKSAAVNVGFETPTALADAELAVADAKPQEKEKRFLPITNVLFLLLITVVCIFVLSVQIDFQVKPFYDLGEKISLAGLVVKGSILAGTIVKCVWPVLLLRYGLRFGEALLQACGVEKSAWLKWCIAGVLLLSYGVYDVLITANPFAWTYLLFYVAFTLVYYLMEKNEKKSFLLIFFIYIF